MKKVCNGENTGFELSTDDIREILELLIDKFIIAGNLISLLDNHFKDNHSLSFVQYEAFKANLKKPDTP